MQFNEKKMNKAICIFTNFWDAKQLSIDGSLLLSSKNQLCKLNFISENNKPVNFSLNSIALSLPENVRVLNFKNIACFNPTYKLLSNYKTNKDWVEYRSEYIKLLKERKQSIQDWANGLIDEHIYFMCCWENTSKGANCHRRILYEEFSKSKFMKNKIISIYRSGGK